MPGKSYFLANAILNGVLRHAAYAPASTIWAALYTVAPTAALPGTEAADPSYSRVPVTFGAPVNGVALNSVSLGFYGEGATTGETIVAVGFKDSNTGGSDNLLYYGLLGVTKAVGPGDSLSFAVGTLSVAER